jgi:hypothetical protein
MICKRKFKCFKYLWSRLGPIIPALHTGMKVTPSHQPRNQLPGYISIVPSVLWPFASSLVLETFLLYTDIDGWIEAEVFTDCKLLKGE